MHALRSDLAPNQLTRVIQVYSHLLHNPYLSSGAHIYCVKTMFNLIDTITAKDTQQNAARILGSLLESCVDKLDSITIIQEELERIKTGKPEAFTIASIEKARPVAAALYVTEKKEQDVMGESPASSGAISRSY